MQKQPFFVKFGAKTNKLNNFTALKKGGIFIPKIRKEHTDMNNIEKAIEIRNARIRFVSLVDKAANL